MNLPPDDLETRLRRRPRPALPDDLKTRVVAAAALAASAASRGDRIWFSRTWRLAAVGLLLALLAVDRWSGSLRPATGAADRPRVAEQMAAVDSLGREIGLSRDDVRQLAERVEFVSLTAPEPRGSIDAALQ